MIGQTQDLLQVESNVLVCANADDFKIIKSIKDLKQNTLILGVFRGTPNFNSAQMDSRFGACFLQKRNSNNQVLWTIQLGNFQSEAHGDIVVDHENNILLGLNYFHGFRFGNKKFVHQDKWVGIILQVNESGELNWKKQFKSSKGKITLSKLAIDGYGSIYGTLSFEESILINNKKYTTPNKLKGSVLFKLDNIGEVLWQKLFFTSSEVKFNAGAYFQPKNEDFGTFYFSGSFSSGYLYDDELNVLVEKNIQAKNQHFLLGIKEYGKTEFCTGLPPEVASVAGINLYNDILFLGGKSDGTLFGKFPSPLSIFPHGIYICQYHVNGEMIQYGELKSNQYTNVTDFEISEHLGFVFSGTFDGKLALNDEQFFLKRSSDRGSFIININDRFHLKGTKVISGDNVQIQDIFILENKISFTSCFKGTANFLNKTENSLNYMGKLYSTTDLPTLSYFSPGKRIFVYENQHISVTPYPNPVVKKLNIEFNEALRSADFVLKNLQGLEVFKWQNVSVDGFSTSLEIPSIPTGNYILQVTSNNYKAGSCRVLKL